MDYGTPLEHSFGVELYELMPFLLPADNISLEADSTLLLLSYAKYSNNNLKQLFQSNANC